MPVASLAHTAFKSSRWLLPALFVFAVCELLTAAQEPFSLIISTSQESITTGAEVQLSVSLTNKLNHEIAIIDTDQICDFTVEVRDSNGQLAPETEQAKNRICGGFVAGKLIVTRLKPGGHQEYRLYLSQLYDITRPGQYDVQVSREARKELGGGRVRSNSIKITVTQ